MRNARLRLGVRPSSYYLGLFDEVQLKPDGAEPNTAYVSIGEDPHAFEVHVPIEFGVWRTDLLSVARSALSQIVEMDDAVRVANPDDDEMLAVITVREFFIELRYWATTYNGDRTEYFSFADGRWRRRGFDLPWMRHWPVKWPGHILAVDAAYGDTHVAAACVGFADWKADTASCAFAQRTETRPEEYESGALYKRELPLLMRLLDQSPVPVSTVVVDGYVWLSGEGKPGLGARLHEALARDVAVIGVAKNRLNGDEWSRAVLRGASKAPLFVTAIGMPLDDAARHIANMSGAHRLPAFLKRADALARAALSGL